VPCSNVSNVRVPCSNTSVPCSNVSNVRVPCSKCK
jgi:hypothetical protein